MTCNLRHPIGLGHPIIGTGWRRLIGSPKMQIFSSKEPLNIGHFCGKWPIKIRDSMSLRHPVVDMCKEIVLFSMASWLRTMVLECHFFILKSQSMTEFLRSLLPRSIEKRPRRLRLRIEIEWLSECNRLYLQYVSLMCANRSGIVSFVGLFCKTDYTASCVPTDRI